MRPNRDTDRAGDHAVFVADVGVNHRWGTVGRTGAPAMGVHAVLSVPLHTRDRFVEVLNLHAHQVTAFICRI